MNKVTREPEETAASKTAKTTKPRARSKANTSDTSATPPKTASKGAASKKGKTAAKSPESNVQKTATTDDARKAKAPAQAKPAQAKPARKRATPSKTPSAEATPAQPAAETTPAQPAAETAPALPAVEPTPTQPSVETAPALPSAETAPALPAAEATPTQPSVETAAALPAADAMPASADAVQTALVPVSPSPAVGPAAPRRASLSHFSRRYRERAMRSRSDQVDDFGLDQKTLGRSDRYLDFLYSTYFRVEARGLSHIPDSGRALIVANHAGVLPYDGAMLMHAVRREHPTHRQVRPLLEDFVFHFPYLGTLLNRIGGVRACQENAERLLLSEQLIAVFPEGLKGTSKLYSERYQLQRFGRGGFIKLALRTGTPIIPAAIVGSEESQPVLGKLTWLARSLGVPFVPITPTFPWLGPLGLLPLPMKWHIAFGPPIHYDTVYGQKEAEDRVLINHLAEQVRQTIQEMIKGLLAGRRSVIFG